MIPQARSSSSLTSSLLEDRTLNNIQQTKKNNRLRKPTNISPVLYSKIIKQPSNKNHPSIHKKTHKKKINFKSLQNDNRISTSLLKPPFKKAAHPLPSTSFSKSKPKRCIRSTKPKAGSVETGAMVRRRNFARGKTPRMSKRCLKKLDF